MTQCILEQFATPLLPLDLRTLPATLPGVHTDEWYMVAPTVLVKRVGLKCWTTLFRREFEMFKRVWMGSLFVGLFPLLVMGAPDIYVDVDATGDNNGRGKCWFWDTRR